jgi:helicase
VRIADLPLDPEIQDVFQEAGFDELYPSQVEAAPLACEGNSVVCAVPTASGKTLVAQMALLQQAMQGRKGIYIVPLRALASEKHRELEELAEPLGLNVRLAMGDLDGPTPDLGDFDVLVCTSEKADSLLRSRSHWLDKLGCVVADEVHLLHDPSRGPTLEVLLTRFRHLMPDAQIVALSATVENSIEIAEWLDAEHVKSDWRPVDLKEGVLHDGEIWFTDDSTREVPAKTDQLDALVQDTLDEGGQIITFVNSRKRAESVAERIGPLVQEHLDADNVQELTDAAGRLRAGRTDPGQERLAEMIGQGSAFHHAGLDNDDRTLVEDRFLDQHLRFVAATPTLAAGLNMPARRVVILDLDRYESNRGRVPIPVLEYKQMAGRAGRPQYDPYGEAVTVADTMDRREEIQFRYLLADPEAIESKLAQDWALRVHILATIASGYASTEQGVHEFVKRTFYAQQSESWTIEHRVEKTLDFLREEGFVEEDDGLEATRFGSLTSELYIDPASAVILRQGVEAAPVDPHPMQLLHTVCATPDMNNLYMRRSDVGIEERAVELEDKVLVPYHERASFEEYCSEVKTAMLLHDWIEEKTNEQLYERYGAYSGDVNYRVQDTRWLLQAAQDLARLFNDDAERPIHKLSLRVRHGAKQQLLPLLELEGLGRYRARQLYKHGVKDKADLKEAEAQQLVNIRGLGPKIVERIKRQLGEDVGEMPEPDREQPEMEGQMHLGHYDE